MTPEVIALLIVQVCTTVVTVAGLYFKHRVDMREYDRTNKRVTKVQSTLENGIRDSLNDTNAKVSSMTDGKPTVVSVKKGTDAG